MDKSRTVAWTRTLYAIVQALVIARKLNFGRLEDLPAAVKEAATWLSPDCSYNSVLLAHSQRMRDLTFRRDPSNHFEEIGRQLVGMLVQDLVTILDEQMIELLDLAGRPSGGYPRRRILALSKNFPPNRTWAVHGCLELVACRNVLTHAASKWNKQSIDQVKGIVSPLPTVGDQLSIGFAMLFRFRKAIRTFVTEAELALFPRQRAKRKKQRKRPSVYQSKRKALLERRARAKAAMAARSQSEA
jgi:hypothetical protein